MGQPAKTYKNQKTKKKLKSPKKFAFRSISSISAETTIISADTEPKQCYGTRNKGVLGPGPKPAPVWIARVGNETKRPVSFRIETWFRALNPGGLCIECSKSCGFEGFMLVCYLLFSPSNSWNHTRDGWCITGSIRGKHTWEGEEKKWKVERRRARLLGFWLISWNDSLGRPSEINILT